jgi:hypothetical protein
VKFYKIIFIFSFIVGSLVKAETGVHGGEPCEQSIEETKISLITTLSEQLSVLGNYIYNNEINWKKFDDLPEQVKITIEPRVFVNGEERAGKSNRITKEITFSRALWCPLVERKKEAQLFHELLVIATNERSKDYHLSGHYINYIKEVERQKRENKEQEAQAKENDPAKWKCTADFYLSIYSYEIGAERLSMDTRETLYGFGATPGDAFKKMAKKRSLSDFKPCLKIVPLPDKKTNSVNYLCEEAANERNSCIQQF